MSGVAPEPPTSSTTALPDQRAKIAVEVAMKQIGLPYVWGGNGPENGHRGFDCSGLTTFAYDKARVQLPRTAHTQFRHGPRVPDGAALQPGDLVFYGTTKKVRHVGMYIGSGRMVNAPTFGKPVQTAWYRYDGDEYLGATRPASIGIGALPAPDPEVPEQPDPSIPDATVFPAPPAPSLPAVPDPRAPQPPAGRSAADSLAGARKSTTPPAPAAAAPPVPTPRPEGSPDTDTETLPPTAPAPAPVTPPSSTPRPTTRPVTPPPVTPAPPTTPPSTATPAVPGSAVGLVLDGLARPVSPVAQGPDGLPAAVGSHASPRGWTVRLDAPLTMPRPGATVLLQLADGTSHSFTIQSTSTASSTEAAASTAPLVIVVPDGNGSWTVIAAG
ncbi:C40 family peptidase [Pseudonocardia nematodicida]|uniref:C40 family peptidase n=1 Tax=Pseudonocardia nematodicida TaxID=1206997 RepID=A0ABV1KEJ1_9PSEU